MAPNLSSPWRYESLGSVATIQSGGTPSRANREYWVNGDIPWVTTAEVNYSIIRDTKEKITRKGLDNSSARVFNEGTLLIALYGQGKTRGQVGLLGIDAATNQACAAIQPNEGLTTEFLFYYLQHSYSRIRALSNAGGQDNLSAELVREIRVPVVPEREQRAIARLLRTWDEAIEKFEKYLKAKREHIAGLNQSLIGRGGQFPSQWDRKSLRKIATRVRRQNDGGRYPVMTISSKAGFLMQSDKFGRDMAGRSVDRYVLLHEGEFAYNKGNSLTAPYGCIYRLERPNALIPFVYYCFALDAELHHPFYEHLFAAGALNYQLSRLINSGVRNDGLLNLNAEDFFSCEVPVPPMEEQIKIAALLSSAKEEARLIEAEIGAIRLQKNGLMQKLFKGEWRLAHENSGEGTS